MNSIDENLRMNIKVTIFNYNYTYDIFLNVNKLWAQKCRTVVNLRNFHF